MTGDPEKFTWSPEQVQVTPPCQACRRRPADDPEIRGLCTTCAKSIDTDYEWLRDLGELEAGP
jgi:hypothetical protein